MKRPVFLADYTIKHNLQDLLDKAIDLRKAVYSKEQEQISFKALKIIQQIKDIEQLQIQKNLPYHQRFYMKKKLEDIKLNAQIIQQAPVEKKIDLIQSMSHTLTYIAHIYGLKKYTVFFCPKNRKVWMQQKKSVEKQLAQNFCNDIVIK